ncbi:MAG: Coenzyme PQQ synthesis protein E [Methanonatronarchaeales archaeon]|nr:Coenzyme PQQ synthesis protein E [Methanonatronarchaeales archaeon]
MRGPGAPHRPVDPAEHPLLVAWESTRACNLACRHCRAEAQPEGAPDQLGRREVINLVDQIAEFSSPIFIITGGEPMLREDVYDVASYADGRGLRVVMSPNGTLLTPDSVERILDAGVRRISVSIDGSTPEVHDDFRGVPGSFESAVTGLGHARDAGLEYQINTTVTKRNVDDLPAMYDRVGELGAAAWDVFMLVPTGRGEVKDELGATRYERVLRWVNSLSGGDGAGVKVTCGPQYRRIRARAGTGSPGASAGGRGCMAGYGFAFVDHRGDVYPCGYFPVQAGNVRDEHFMDVYRDSELFRELRDPSLLEGKCGVCEFRESCFGCRARAYGVTGSYMAPDPCCSWVPSGSP